MTKETVVSILQEGILQIIYIAGPVLIVALIVGLVIALFQAITSIQEQTLTFVPKILAILGMIALLGSWMLSTLSEYVIRLFIMIPSMAMLRIVICWIQLLITAGFFYSYLEELLP